MDIYKSLLQREGNLFTKYIKSLQLANCLPSILVLDVELITF